MLDERKAAILEAVVEEYIETAQPVGSGHVARLARIGVSPATVRNEMAALERDGFLVQPHVSAGRVPTDKGYRFYVDHLSAPAVALAPVHRHQVREFFAQAHGELEEMLRDTSRLLSNLTDCAAVVVAPPHEGARVRAAQVVSLNSRQALVVVVLSDGVIEKATVELDTDVGPERVSAAGVHLAAHLTGRSLDELVPLPPTGDSLTDKVAEAAMGALRHHDAHDFEHVFVGGASRMAVMFDAIDTVRQVLAILEQQYLVVSLLREALAEERLRVAIGAEHGVESLAECSIVVAPYEAGSRAGRVGVLGPTRMNYAQAMAAVAVVSWGLGQRLRED